MGPEQPSDSGDGPTGAEGRDLPRGVNECDQAVKDALDALSASGDTRIFFEALRLLWRSDTSDALANACCDHLARAAAALAARIQGADYDATGSMGGPVRAWLWEAIWRFKLERSALGAPLEEGSLVPLQRLMRDLAPGEPLRFLAMDAVAALAPQLLAVSSFLGRLRPSVEQCLASENTDELQSALEAAMRMGYIAPGDPRIFAFLGGATPPHAIASLLPDAVGLGYIDRMDPRITALRSHPDDWLRGMVDFVQSDRWEWEP